MCSFSFISLYLSVVSGTLLHGSNLFPDVVLPSMRPIVTEYLAAMNHLGHVLMQVQAVFVSCDIQHLSLLSILYFSFRE